jgi:hypothetical protein
MSKVPKEIKIIAGGYEMTLGSPKIIERIMREWEAEHPGCSAEQMTSEEFAKRMMQAMYASAVKLQTGTA